MKTFALATFVGATVAIDSIEYKFIQHLVKFAKSYSDVEEFNARLEFFKNRDAIIEASNAVETNFTLGHNQFSDWSSDEYRAILGGIPPLQEVEPVWLAENGNTPKSINWVELGGVTPVKDQGSCGSCWAFSTTGSLEGAHFRTTGQLLSFSEQQLVDCAYGSQYGSYGCNGGWPTGAMTYYETNAAVSEADYPYTSGHSTRQKSCKYSAAQTTGVNVSQYANVPANNVNQMKIALQYQPLSVLVEADNAYFQSYSSGIVTSDACGTNLDHAVLAVGYGVDADTGLKYWLVKNSWNTWWGDQGYIKLAQEKAGPGVCGVQMSVAYPSAN